jgi:hypothetical protein
MEKSMEKSMGSIQGFNRHGKMNFQRNVQKLRQDTAKLAENHKKIIDNYLKGMHPF